MEYIRMGFDKDDRWRLSDINKEFELCNTYPRFLIIPSCFKDEDLDSVAKFRYLRRIPTAVWRHTKNGCFIVRSSQPTVGWFGWFRNEFDENLVQSYVNNTMPPNGEQPYDDNKKQLSESVDNSEDGQQSRQPTFKEVDENGSSQNSINNHIPLQQLKQQKSLQNHKNHNNNLQDTTNNLITGNGKSTRSIDSSIDLDNGIKTSAVTLQSPQLPIMTTNNVNDSSSPLDNSTSALEVIATTSKMLIIDARSYAAAMANRAKGGGCECSEYYQRCEVQFMNLANIHSIRKSFHAIKSVCEAYSEQSNNWVSFLDNSRWLHHISGLLKSALLVVDTIDVEQKSILIHCSDGWDRTPQLVALAEIMLDPHYRTFDGFRALIQREWLDFGHKFADRCGINPSNEDPNERCPVFLQWLDCVQQLLVQFPKHFEFNSLYLDKLNRHTYSNVFGTFSYNSNQERILARVEDRSLSLWSYFDSSRRRFKNDKYIESDEILRPSFKVRDLHFWKEVYLPPIRNQTPYNMPIASNIDNKKFYDSLYIVGLTRTVCK